MDLYIPTPKAIVFLTCPAQETFFGGAGGGGKTRSDLELAAQYCTEFAGIRVAIFRRTTDEHRFLIDQARLMLAPYGITINENIGNLRFPNESIIHCRHAFRRHDIEKALSEEYALIIFDEASTFLPYQLDYAKTRNRTPVHGARVRWVATSNPRGVSHMHLLKEFVTPDPEIVERVIGYYPWGEAERLWESLWPRGKVGPPEQLAEAKLKYLAIIDQEGIGWRVYDDLTQQSKQRPEPGMALSTDRIERIDIWRARPSKLALELGMQTGRTRCYIPAYLHDNPHISQEEYAQTLANLGDENVARAMLLGDWSVFEGQFFHTFSKTRHVIDSLLPEPHWIKWASMDWGYSQAGMCVVLWHTYDPEHKRIITYRELAVNQLEDEQIIDRFLGLSRGENLAYLLVDRSMFNRQMSATNATLGLLWKHRLANTCDVQGAVNERVEGWRVVRNAMANRVDTGWPGWVCTNDCTYLIDTLPQLVYDEFRDEDLDSDGPDHAADALRYGLMNAPSIVGRAPRKAPNLGGFTPGARLLGRVTPLASRRG